MNTPRRGWSDANLFIDMENGPPWILSGDGGTDCVDYAIYFGADEVTALFRDWLLNQVWRRQAKDFEQFLQGVREREAARRRALIRAVSAP